MNSIFLKTLFINSMSIPIRLQNYNKKLKTMIITEKKVVFEKVFNAIAVFLF